MLLQAIPFAIIYFGLSALSVSSWRPYLTTAFCGGLVMVLIVIVGISWTTVTPMFTEERVSSTAGLAFLVIPLLGAPAGVLGMLLAMLAHAGIRRCCQRDGRELL